MTLRKMAKKTGISASTLCRIGQGKPLKQEYLIKVLSLLDPDLAAEVVAALAYLRASISRRAREDSKARRK